MISTGIAISTGLVLGVLTAPLAVPVAAGTVYLVRRAINIEFQLLNRYTEVGNLKSLKHIRGKDLMGLSLNILFSRSSWKAVLVSLVKLPLGIIAFSTVMTYYALSIGLIAAPALFKYEVYMIVGSRKLVDTSLEAIAAGCAGLIL